MSCKAKAGSLFAVERNVTKLVAFHPARSLKILPHDTQASSHFSAKFPARPKNIRSHQRPDLFRLRSRAGSNLVLPPLRRRAEVPPFPAGGATDWDPLFQCGAPMPAVTEGITKRT
jgi:hypothetical protein